jgi:hypothetical protein
MQIMNATNYSNSKQNQPNFGMVLNFTPTAKRKIGKKDFASLVEEVRPWITKGGHNPIVKGTSVDDTCMMITLAVEEGLNKAQRTLYNDANAVREALKKIFDFLN